MLKLTLVKIEANFNYSKYLHWFDFHTQKHILSYHFEKDRIVAFTSALLKYYYIPSILNINPKTIKIGYNTHKRPYLISNPEYDFNLSHSGIYVLLGISQNRVGVDIEKIDPNIEIDGMSKVVFSEPEITLVKNNVDNFFTLWSKKEAYLKALGGGFFEQYHITSLNLSKEEQINDYKIYAVNCDPSYKAAICISN